MLGDEAELENEAELGDETELENEAIVHFAVLHHTMEEYI